MAVLQYAVLLGLAIQSVSAGWFSPVYKNFFSVPLPVAPIKQPKKTFTNPNTGGIINYYEIEIKPVEIQIYPPPMKKARFVGYDGMIPGPTFMQNQYEEAIVRFINHGDRSSSIHLHGSYSRAPFDGYADDITPIDGYKDYYYPNAQNGRMLWYHDHAVDHTAENAYYGQAGVYILRDSYERGLGLPNGKYDVPLALSGKYYNPDGTLWDPEANGETTSVYGDVIHVNGAPWPYFDVEPRKYRFRLLNSGISRTYRLYMEDDTKPGTRLTFTVIGADTGLLEKSVPTQDLYMSVAERWEIIMDFTNYANKKITLKNEKGVGADSDFDGTDRVMQFRVGNKVTDTSGNGAIPTNLRTVPYPPNKAGIDNSMVFQHDGGMWNINGHVWSDGIDARVLAKPKRGSIEVWELINKSGGWTHPIHIHLIDFQVISRTGGSRGVQPYEAVALKDVVWVGPNERVLVIARYSPWDGIYMFHCHNLIHEDHEMLAMFNVTFLADFGYPEKTHFIDPMEDRYRAKPCKTGEFQSVDTWGNGEFSLQGVTDKVNWFAGLEAYKDADKVELALEEYWGRTSLVHTAAPTPTTLITSKVTSAAPAKTSTCSKVKGNTVCS
ncbi:Cupredoxin [Clohesyomyces aquaticus]|uniref:Cupredoxin n=1 Tax=Clohesyomyces aquaticus TaxID=1231657 RepID=A0A1Y1Z4W6_9PLEO|nr:Cupredoxin [Clohesyomyces aquaticus]